MSTYKVVVDGSNIATEGRTRPSLTQLDEAVRAFIEEHPGADMLVIVDSSFPNRVDPADLPIFEAAYNAGEIITPPAGTIGRGDSFILKVADKLHATVFSNDSFQEFHGTYDWLFEKGRLMGGKPIPGFGWVFTPRTPVRGPKSRDAVREAKRTRVRVGSKEATKPMPVPKAPPPFMLKQVADHALAIAEAAGEPDARRGRRKRANKKEEAVAAAVLAGTVEGMDEDRKRTKKRRRKGNTERPIDPVNDALPFLTFVANNRIGVVIEGEVAEYSSHGLFVAALGTRCYVPLSGLADPMPRSAKEVVRKGTIQSWVVKSFEPSRRSIELALVGSPGSVGIVPTEVGADEMGRAADDGETAPAQRVRKAVKRVGATARAPKRAPEAAESAEAPVVTSVEPVRPERPRRRVTTVPAADVAVPVESSVPGGAASSGRGRPARRVAAPPVVVEEAAAQAAPRRAVAAIRPVKAVKSVRHAAASAPRRSSKTAAVPVGHIEAHVATTVARGAAKVAVVRARAPKVAARVAAPVGVAATTPVPAKRAVKAAKVIKEKAAARVAPVPAAPPPPSIKRAPATKGVVKRTAAASRPSTAGRAPARTAKAARVPDAVAPKSTKRTAKSAAGSARKTVAAKS